MLHSVLSPLGMGKGSQKKARILRDAGNFLPKGVEASKKESGMV